MSAPLQDVFTAFASFGASSLQEAIDSAKFIKLCKDTKLVDRRLSKTDVDLIFTKAKDKGERKLDWHHFVHALELIAEKKGTSVDAIVDQIVTAGGPSINGTIADPVKFHDDKSTYTGVYAKGGPTNIDRDNVSLDRLLDRTDADVRGVKAESYLATDASHDAAAPHGAGEARGSLSVNTVKVDEDGQASMPIAPRSPAHEQPPEVPKMPSAVASSHGAHAGDSAREKKSSPPSSSSTTLPPVVQRQAPPQHSAAREAERTREAVSPLPSAEMAHSSQRPANRGSASSPAPGHQAAHAEPTDDKGTDEAIFETFRRFAGLGNAGEVNIDSFKFSKLLKDTNLIDRKLTTTAADLIYTKAKAKGAVRMTYGEFKMLAIPLIAQTKGVEDSDVIAHLTHSTGPKLHATVPDAVRFHDDKSSYTGVYAKGGPTNIDNQITLNTLADRDNAADVRGAVHLPAGPIAPQHEKPVTSGAAPQAQAKRSSITGGASSPSPSPPKDSPPSSAVTLPPASSSSHATGGAGGHAASSNGAASHGNIYDRLNDKSTYTGVYARRFSGGEMGGRINDDTINVNHGGGHTGSTTTAKTDSTVRDLSDLVRR